MHVDIPLRYLAQDWMNVVILTKLLRVALEELKPTLDYKYRSPFAFKIWIQGREVDPSLGL